MARHMPERNRSRSPEQQSLPIHSLCPDILRPLSEGLHPGTLPLCKLALHGVCTRARARNMERCDQAHRCIPCVMSSPGISRSPFEEGVTGKVGIQKLWSSINSSQLASMWCGASCVESVESANTAMNCVPTRTPVHCVYGHVPPRHSSSHPFALSKLVECSKANFSSRAPGRRLRAPGAWPPRAASPPPKKRSPAFWNSEVWELKHDDMFSPRAAPHIAVLCARESAGRSR